MARKLAIIMKIMLWPMTASCRKGVQCKVGEWVPGLPVCVDKRKVDENMMMIVLILCYVIVVLCYVM